MLNRYWRRAIVFITAFIVAAFVVAAFFDNEFRSRSWDPQQMRDYVERTIHFGGTFYENGLLNKGPLEPVVYRLAAALTSWEGFWYAISFFILIVSGLVAWAASRAAQVVGGHRLLGVALGIGVFFHFTLGKADYAGVLYSRNMIVGLLAAAWLVALAPNAWTPERAWRSSIVIGVLLGLATQTLLVSAIAAVAVGLVAWSEINDIFDDALYRKCRRTLVAAPVLVTLAAPVYYAARGRFDEFWSGWWTYALYQNSGTGRSLANQLTYGREVILRYYRTWPVSLVIVVAFVVMTIALWRTLERRERAVHASISLWFVGAWVELVLGQRYSSHYFAVLAVPTALMAAVVVGHMYRLLKRDRGEFRSVIAWPLVACVLTVAAWGGQHLDLGLQAASKFTSVHQAAAARAANTPGNERTVRATLDLVSKADDPLLTWTEFPWPYLNFRRVSATRFIWKSFMLGQIYFGRTGPQYVLPKTWQWFAEDMREAKPTAFLEETALPLTPDTPFADYVAANFDIAYAGPDYNIYLRHDQAAAVLFGDRGDPNTSSATFGDATKWKVTSGGASLAIDSGTPVEDALQLSSSLCTRISGTYLAQPGAAGSFLSFRFDNPATTSHMRLNIVDSRAMSGSDTTVFESVPLSSATADDAESEVTDPSPHTFAVVVGSVSAALVIDGEIRAAVRLDGERSVSLEVRNGGVVLSDLRVGPPPPNSGCGG
ncbi:MAG: hypothetical protein WCJ32_02965 [Actinomycetota bacterium]